MRAPAKWLHQKPAALQRLAPAKPSKPPAKRAGCASCAHRAAASAAAVNCQRNPNPHLQAPARPPKPQLPARNAPVAQTRQMQPWLPAALPARRPVGFKRYPLVGLEYPLSRLSAGGFLGALFGVPTWGTDVRPAAEKETEKEKANVGGKAVWEEKWGANLLFGELLPEGAHDLLMVLEVQRAQVLCDLGAGFGRLALQAFLSFTNLERVLAIELSPSRFNKGVEGLENLAKMAPDCFKLYRTHAVSGADCKSVWEVQRLELIKDPSTGRPLAVPRVFDLCQGDMFAASIQETVGQSDITICHAALPPNALDRFVALVKRLKRGSRFSFVPRYQSIPPNVLQNIPPFVEIREPQNSLRLVRPLYCLGQHAISASWAPTGTDAILPTIAL